MKGILNKTEQGWVITYDEVIVKKNSAIPIGKIAFISKLYDSNKGILNKTNRGWVVKQVVKEGPDAKLINQYPLVDNGHIDGLKLYDSNEGLEVYFEIVTDYDNNRPDHFPKFARILTPEEAELKDWDVTLNDGLEDEPYISDDFQIGPDGAYEHTEDWPEDTTPREKAKSELINLLLYQIMDLTVMSKIELGDDVIAEIKRLKDIIKII